MITATGVIIVILIYIIPSYLLIYIVSQKIVEYFIELSGIHPGNINYSFINIEISELMVWLMFIFIIILLFILVRFLLYILQRYLYLTREWDLYDKIDEIFTRHDKGLNTINFWGRLIVLALVILMIYLKIYDVKLFVFAVILNLFIFKEYKVKKRDKDLTGGKCQENNLDELVE